MSMKGTSSQSTPDTWENSSLHVFNPCLTRLTPATVHYYCIFSLDQTASNKQPTDNLQFFSSLTLFGFVLDLVVLSKHTLPVGLRLSRAQIYFVAQPEVKLNPSFTLKRQTTHQRKAFQELCRDLAVRHMTYSFFLLMVPERRLIPV